MKKVLLSFLASGILSTAVYAQHYTAVSMGTQFGMALRSDSTLWGWGFNENGQLATSDTSIQLSPVSVAAINKWIAVSAGAFHTLAISYDSTLWGWGSDQIYQLGESTASAINNTPVHIESAHHWRSISAGYVNSAAIRADGTLWVSGWNAYGQLGQGDTTTYTSLVQVGTDNDWKAVSVGGVHMVALKNDGTLWAWGYNGDGELGHDGTIGYYTLPVQIGAASDWVAISAGFEYTAALKSDGTIWNCGFNANGELGRMTTLTADSVLTQMGTGNNWHSLSAGATFCFAIKNDSTLWGWGFNGAGQLGFAASSAVDTPTMVSMDNNWATVAAATGAVSGSFAIGASSVGFKTGGMSLCTSGDNQGAQLGIGTMGGQQDYFGCSVAPTEAVAKVQVLTNNVILYPNPASTTLYVQLPERMNGKQNAVGIMDMNGRTCISKVIDGDASIDVQSLPQGIYMLHVVEQNGMVTNKTFTKE